MKARADAWAAAQLAEAQPELSPDAEPEEPAEEQDAGHPHVGPTPTPPTLDALGSAPRPGQHAHRPVPSAVVEPPRTPAVEWLPVVLHPWASRFVALEPMLPLIQRVHHACGIVGGLQVAGEFGRDEAQVLKTFNAWRAFTVATGRLPADGVIK